MEKVDMTNNSWWGNFNFDIGQTRFWQIGPCILCIERTAQQWRIAQHYTDETSEEIQIGVAKISSIKPKKLIFKQYNFQQTADTLVLIPMLADRPQVSRPELPFYIPGFEKVSLYISSPAWIRIATGDPLRILQDIPIQRLSDTWFGENTLEGELCYASRTRCRMQLDTASLNSHRVITQVTIDNQLNENFLVQRIKLPLPSLSIYASADQNLWTENLDIEKISAKGMVTRIESNLTTLALSAELVSEPRLAVTSNRIIDLFSQIL